MIINDKSKKTGSYYTPSILSDFLIEHVFNEYIKEDTVEILEPSCGDGQFLHSLFGKDYLGNKKTKIDLIDINLDELNKAVDLCHTNGKKNLRINAINKDFLEFQAAAPQKYSLIIGNPPYIKKNYLSKKQSAISKEIHEKTGVIADGMKNIWPAFLLASISLLNDNGVLCFVLPAELLQVKYTKPLREKVLSIFKKLEIFAFNELIFPDIEQDVIVLIGSKKASLGEQGISFYQVEKLDDLKEPLYTKKHSNVHRTTLDKWTNYILSDDELIFIDAYKQSWKKVKDYSEKVEAGIVTAANSFFIVNNDTIRKHKLDEYAKPIISRSRDLKRTIIFNKADLNKCSKNDLAVNLISFKNIKQCELKKNAISYVEKLREEGLHERYKFKHRTHWHHVPLVGPGDGFFTKRSHLFPRIISNEAKVYVTDSFYLIHMNGKYNIKSLTFSFYNTLTLILCELEGRYYGGGVLELTPNEFKNISVPYVEVTDEQFKGLDEMFQSSKRFDEILKYTNKIILQDSLGLKESDIQRMKVIYKKLVDRRLKQVKVVDAPIKKSQIIKLLSPKVYEEVC